MVATETKAAAGKRVAATPVKAEIVKRRVLGNRAVDECQASKTVDVAVVKKRPGRPRKYKTVEERRKIRLEKNREAAKRLYAKKVGGFKTLESEVVSNRAAIAAGKAKMAQYEKLLKQAGVDAESLRTMLEQEMARIAADRRASDSSAPANHSDITCSSVGTLRSNDSAGRPGSSSIGSKNCARSHAAAAATKRKQEKSRGERDGTRTPEFSSSLPPPASYHKEEQRPGSFRPITDQKAASNRSVDYDDSSDDDAAAITMLQLLETAAPSKGVCGYADAQTRLSNEANAASATVTCVKHQDDMDCVLDMMDEVENGTANLNDKCESGGVGKGAFRRSASLRSILAHSVSSDRLSVLGTSGVPAAPMTVLDANCAKSSMMCAQPTTAWGGMVAATIATRVV